MGFAGSKTRTSHYRASRLGDRSRSVVIVVLLVVVGAACGSTLPQAERAAIGEVSGISGLDADTLPPGARINKAGQVVNAEGQVIGDAEDFGISTGADTVASGSSDSGVSSQGGSRYSEGVETAPGKNGPGITADTIKLGLYTIANYREGQEALGSQAAGDFHMEAGWKALIEYQNAHGGIAGRKITPVFWRYSAASTETYAQQEANACARWTEDDRIFAALTYVFTTNILECLSEGGAVIHSLDTPSGRAITPIFKQYPYYTQMAGLPLDQVAGAMIEGLHGMRYFSDEMKLGLVTFDDPSFKYATENVLIPSLKQRRLSLTDAAYMHPPQNTAEIAQLSSDAANAVLRFKSEGIDHVVFLDWGLLAAWQFMLAAERQDYHPRYGLHAGQNVANLLGNDAASQMRDARSIGWVSTYDVHPQDDPNEKNPTRVLCFSIMRKAGVDISTTAGRSVSLTQCDGVWSLAAALDGASIVNQTTYLAGVNALRGGYSPGLAWSMTLDPGHHWGVSSVANLGFVQACSCFRYLSRPYSIR